MEWVRETPARWDASKADVLGELSPELFGLGRPADGDALADEWWRVEQDGEVLGYGRLDETWGDAEVLMLVAADRHVIHYHIDDPHADFSAAMESLLMRP